MSPQPQTNPAPPQLTAANHYELRNGSLNITYTATDLLGRPQLSFQDGKQARHYVGDQIRREETALGLLLSVGDAPTDERAEPATTLRAAQTRGSVCSRVRQMAHCV